MPQKKSPASARRGSSSTKKRTSSSRKSATPKKTVVAKKVATPKKTVAKRTSRSSSRSSSRGSSRGSSSKKAATPKKLVIKPTSPQKPLNLTTLSETQIKQIAKKYGLKVTPTMKKADIIKLIQQKAKASPAKQEESPVDVSSDEVVSEDTSSEEGSSDEQLPYSSPKATPSLSAKDMYGKYAKYSLSKLKEECENSGIPPSALKGKKCSDLKTSNRKEIQLAMVKHQLEKLQKEKQALEQKLLAQQTSIPDYGFSSDKWKECPDKNEIYDIASKDCRPPTYDGFSQAGIRRETYEAPGGKKYTIAGTDSQLKEFEEYFKKRTVTPSVQKAEPPKKEWWQQGCYDPAEYDRLLKQNPKTYVCEAREPEKPGYSTARKGNPNKFYLQTSEGRKIHSMTLSNLQILQEKIGGEIYALNASKKWEKVASAPQPAPSAVYSVTQSVHTTPEPSFSVPFVEERKVPSPVRQPAPSSVAPSSVAVTQHEDEVIRNIRNAFARCLQNLPLV